MSIQQNINQAIGTAAAALSVKKVIETQDPQHTEDVAAQTAKREHLEKFRSKQPIADRAIKDAQDLKDLVRPKLADTDVEVATQYGREEARHKKAYDTALERLDDMLPYIDDETERTKYAKLKEELVSKSDEFYKKKTRTWNIEEAEKKKRQKEKEADIEQKIANKANRKAKKAADFAKKQKENTQLLLNHITNLEAAEALPQGYVVGGIKE